MTWIDASEELPPVGPSGYYERVLVWVDSPHWSQIYIATYDTGGTGGWWDDENCAMSITHWHPLPDRPKQKE